MRNEEVLNLEEVGKVGIGAAVVAIVGAVFAYFRSIGNKIDKAEFEHRVAERRSEVDKMFAELRLDFEKQIEVLNRRHSAWETRSERFATRDLVDALNVKIERMEERQDRGFEKINLRLDKLIEESR